MNYFSASVVAIIMVLHAGFVSMLNDGKQASFGNANASFSAGIIADTWVA